MKFRALDFDYGAEAVFQQENHDAIILVLGTTRYQRDRMVLESSNKKRPLLDEEERKLAAESPRKNPRYLSGTKDNGHLTLSSVEPSIIKSTSHRTNLVSGEAQLNNEEAPRPQGTLLLRLANEPWHEGLRKLSRPPIIVHKLYRLPPPLFLVPQYRVGPCHFDKTVETLRGCLQLNQEPSASFKFSWLGLVRRTHTFGLPKLSLRKRMSTAIVPYVASPNACLSFAIQIAMTVLSIQTKSGLQQQQVPRPSGEIKTQNIDEAAVVPNEDSSVFPLTAVPGHLGNQPVQEDKPEVFDEPWPDCNENFVFSPLKTSQEDFYPMETQEGPQLENHALPPMLGDEEARALKKKEKKERKKRRREKKRNQDKDLNGKHHHGISKKQRKAKEPSTPEAESASKFGKKIQRDSFDDSVPIKRPCLSDRSQSVVDTRKTMIADDKQSTNHRGKNVSTIGKARWVEGPCSIEKAMRENLRSSALPAQGLPSSRIQGSERHGTTRLDMSQNETIASSTGNTDKAGANRRGHCHASTSDASDPRHQLNGRTTSSCNTENDVTDSIRTTSGGLNCRPRFQERPSNLSLNSINPQQPFAPSLERNQRGSISSCRFVRAGNPSANQGHKLLNPSAAVNEIPTQMSSRAGKQQRSILVQSEILQRQMSKSKMEHPSKGTGSQLFDAFRQNVGRQSRTMCTKSGQAGVRHNQEPMKQSVQIMRPDRIQQEHEGPGPILDEIQASYFKWSVAEDESKDTTELPQRTGQASRTGKQPQWQSNSSNRSDSMPMQTDHNQFDKVLLSTVRCLCSEKFLESNAEIATELATGRWSGRTTSSCTRVVSLVDTPLLDLCQVDIETPDGRAIVVISASRISAPEAAKDTIYHLVELAASLRYGRITVFVSFDTAQSDLLPVHLSKLHCGLSDQNGQRYLSQVSIVPMPLYKISSGIAKLVLHTRKPPPDQAIIDHEATELVAAPHPLAIDRATFLLELLPSLSAYGALQCIVLADRLVTNGVPGFVSLLTNKSLQQQIILLSTNKQMGIAINPAAIIHLSKVLQAPL